MFSGRLGFGDNTWTCKGNVTFSVEPGGAFKQPTELATRRLFSGSRWWLADAPRFSRSGEWTAGTTSM